MRIVVIGAGMAGILAGIKLKAMGLEFAIYEKADRIGGTWRENTYPGLTCDVPSHHYTYSFARNPDWTRHLSPGPEIQAYFEQCCDSFAIRDHICFNTGVAKAEWDGERWQLTLSNGRSDSADIVIAATGVLHHPALPPISGMETFEGALFHTARWDHAVALQDRRVGVIGMGSTGVQIISALAGVCQKLEHYVRTPQWIMPVENGHFSKEERVAFRNDPATLEAAMDVETYTSNVEAYTDGLTKPDSPGAQIWRSACIDNLEMNVRDPVLKEALRPDHEPMCKRLIFSPDYYEKIQHPDTRLVRADITGIEPEGIRTSDGELHELDVIALATGFRADQFMRPMQILGENGADLDTLWSHKPIAYLAISMPGFPNFFMLNGPNGPVGNFSLIDIAEHQWNYIEQLMAPILKGEKATVAPTPDAMARFDAERIEAAKQTVWYTGGCQSWYLDVDGIPASWPWNYSRFVEEMKAPKWEHFA
ncbi:MAG: NAD(P)/FAD-dependent oxidoreductase [Pseudomonadota bacterium]